MRRSETILVTDKLRVLRLVRKPLRHAIIFTSISNYLFLSSGTTFGGGHCWATGSKEGQWEALGSDGRQGKSMVIALGRVGIEVSLQMQVTFSQRHVIVEI